MDCIKTLEKLRFLFFQEFLLKKAGKINIFLTKKESYSTLKVIKRENLLDKTSVFSFCN